jgi:trk system potassium uptake protein
MRVVILGGGRLGKKITKLLDTNKVEVTLIDNNENLCKSLAEEVNAKIMCCDARQEEKLFEAGIKDADYFIAATGNDETNLLTCLMVRENSKAKLATRILNDNYKRIFEKSGVDIIVSPESVGAQEMYKLITSPDMIELGNESQNLVLVDLMIKEETKAENKKIEELGEGLDFKIAGVKKDDGFFIPPNDTLLLPGDRVIVVCNKAHVDKVKAIFTK